MSISFFVDDAAFPKAIQKRKLQTIAKQIIAIENKKKLSYINIISCSDSKLKEINVQFLSHDYYTDIITFDYDIETIESDIYISIDRITDNAIINKVSVIQEFNRIFIHGILHLVGYKDSTTQERSFMTIKEDEYLQKLNVL